MKTIFIWPTFVINIHIDQEMATNDLSASSSSESEVSEMEDYELEVEGSPNSSYMALLFGVIFTVKRYEMKKYPFLFVPNIATTENNTSFRHIASVLASYNQTRTTLQHAKIIVRVLRHKLNSTHSLSASSAARQWVIESRFSATLKIHKKFRF